MASSAPELTDHFRDPWVPVYRGFGMSTRLSICAIARGTDQSRPEAPLILGALLLLISP
jgi:hypothetical protein